MTKNTAGWIVRTEAAGRHRYWKVGLVDADLAAAIARDAAGADTAIAVTRIPSTAAAAYGLSPDIVKEVIWESRPVAPLSGQSESEGQIGAGKKLLGEISFDIIVPDDGIEIVEGCYRINGGNWQVYYLTNRNNGVPWVGAPDIKNNAVFHSGISGVSGVVPVGWVLNKMKIRKILAEAVGVDEWIEVQGPDSLMLK